MDIVISNSSNLPIYEQIASRIREAILSGELTPGQALPSIRALANDLRVSVITTKRAYTELETAGFIDSVQGKGSFVTGGSLHLQKEEAVRSLELRLAAIVEDAAPLGLSTSDLHEMIDLLCARTT